MAAPQDWERLSGKALEKASRLLGPGVEPDYAKKFGRKTVFAADWGIFRLYLIDDGYIYALKAPSGTNLDASAQDLVGAVYLYHPSQGWAEYAKAISKKLGLWGFYRIKASEPEGK